jgi:hypothetical protein
LARGLLLVWVTGAVGIIGSEDNPANSLYIGVLGVGLEMPPNVCVWGYLVPDLGRQRTAKEFFNSLGHSATFALTEFYSRLRWS